MSQLQWFEPTEMGILWDDPQQAVGYRVGN
jgi:hypothetical protein